MSDSTPARRRGRFVVMLKARTLVLVVGLLALAAVIGTARGGPNAKIAKLLNGKWDLGQRMRGLPVLMVIRQDGNLYPSIWGGVPVGGTFIMEAAEDMLTEDLSLSSKGGFTLRIARIPPKTGMDDVLPLGPLPRRGEIRMEFKEFRNWKRVAAQAVDRGDVRLEADYKAALWAGDASVPIDGRAIFIHSLNVGNFSFDTHFTINGADFGLEGDQARPMHVKVHTFTAVSKDLPEMKQNMGDVDREE
jgi:hypothetical protein